MTPQTIFVLTIFFVFYYYFIFIGGGGGVFFSKRISMENYVIVCLG